MKVHPDTIKRLEELTGLSLANAPTTPARLYQHLELHNFGPKGHLTRSLIREVLPMPPSRASRIYDDLDRTYTFLEKFSPAVDTGIISPTRVSRLRVGHSPISKITLQVLIAGMIRTFDQFGPEDQRPLFDLHISQLKEYLNA